MSCAFGVALIVLLMGGVSACAQDGTVVADVPDGGGLETVVAPQGQEIEFPLCGEGEGNRICSAVNMRLVACSAKISCEPSLLHDPRTLERGPTLVTGFSCGFEQGTPPQEVLLGYHPDIRCYEAGDVADPGTWLPRGGIVPALLPADHIFYAHQADTSGDVYSNAALVMAPLKGRMVEGQFQPFAFCEVAAWGAVSFSPRHEGPLAVPGCTGDACVRLRRGAHIQWAPAIRWRGVVSWSEASGWDCHAAAPAPETWVDRVVLTAATHDLPYPLEKGNLPATHDYALLSVESRPHAELAGEHHTLIVRYAEDSEFPMAPQNPPVPMVERNLWVRTPVAGPPADIAVTWSCAEVGASGEVTRIGVLLKERSFPFPLGAMVIEKNGADGPWDCVREAGECALLEASEWAALTPCLLPVAVP